METSANIDARSGATEVAAQPSLPPVVLAEAAKHAAMPVLIDFGSVLDSGKTCLVMQGDLLPRYNLFGLHEILGTDDSQLPPDPNFMHQIQCVRLLKILTW
jgi:hypothetical protein